MILFKFIREKWDCDWLPSLRNKDEEFYIKTKTHFIEVGF